MSQDEEIASKITHVRGPHGQTVVLVPPKQEFTQEQNDTCMCMSCAVIFTTLGAVLLLLGTIFLSVYLSTGAHKSTNNKVLDSFFIATVSLLGIGVFFMVVTVPMFCFVSDYHSTIVDRYMYRDDPEERLPVLRQEEVFSEEVDPEAFAISYEMYNPTESEAPVYRTSESNHRGNYLPGYHGIPMGSVRADPSLRGIYGNPSRRNYTAYSAHAAEQGDSYYGHQQRHYEDRSSPSQNHLYYPGRAYPGRAYPGTASPHHSSPGGERSFSPSSDTTYLSYYSSGAEGQSGYRA